MSITAFMGVPSRVERSVNAINIAHHVNVINMQSRRTYHHGSLRRALLDEGSALLAEVGPDAFSLNELARRVGVSAAAPYRHFADRNAILDAIADEGYGYFHDGLRAAIAASSDEEDAIRRIGVAYLTFAADYPAFFTVMFRDRPGRAESEAGPPSFETLVSAVEAAQRSRALDPRVAPRLLARSIWAILHGGAVLHGSGGFRKLGIDAPLDELADELLAAFLGAQ